VETLDSVFSVSATYLLANTDLGVLSVPCYSNLAYSDHRLAMIQPSFSTESCSLAPSYQYF